MGRLYRENHNFAPVGRADTGNMPGSKN